MKLCKRSRSITVKLKAKSKIIGIYSEKSDTPLFTEETDRANIGHFYGFKPNEHKLCPKISVLDEDKKLPVYDFWGHENPKYEIQ